ncbi:MAG: oligosaccharide flippase family protein, partial [Actinomycetota bacterium]
MTDEAQALPAAPSADGHTDILDTGEAGGAVIRGGIVRSAAYVAGVLLGLLAAPLMVRHLGVVEFGRYVTVTALIFIVGGFTEAGLNTVGLREHTNRPPSERIALLRSLQGLRIALSLVGVAVAVAFAAAAGYGAEMVAGAAVAGAGLVLSNVLFTYQLPLLTDLKLGWTALLDLTRQAGIVAAVGALVLVGAGLLPFFATVAVGAAVTILATAPLVRRRSSLRPKIVWSEWAALLRETLPFAAATALGFAYYRVVILFTSIVAGEVTTGNFSVAFRIVEVAIGIPWLLAGSAFPILVRAARDDADRLRYALQRLFDVTFLVGALAALVMAVGAQFAIAIVAGEEPAEAVRAMRILGVSLVGTFPVATLGFALLTLRAYRPLLLANLGALLLAGGLAAALVPPYGATGGAIAAAATEFALALTYGVVVARVRPDLRPHLGVVPRVALAAGLA